MQASAVCAVCAPGGVRAAPRGESRAAPLATLRRTAQPLALQPVRRAARPLRAALRVAARSSGDWAQRAPLGAPLPSPPQPRLALLPTSLRSLLAKLRAPALALALGLALLAFPSNALAARSSGRMGGRSFSSRRCVGTRLDPVAPGGWHPVR